MTTTMTYEYFRFDTFVYRMPTPDATKWFDAEAIKQMELWTGTRWERIPPGDAVEVRTYGGPMSAGEAEQQVMADRRRQLMDEKERYEREHGTPLDRYNRMYKRLLLNLPPADDETEAEKQERLELTEEINEMAKKGQVPSIPFD